MGLIIRATCSTFGLIIKATIFYLVGPIIKSYIFYIRAHNNCYTFYMFCVRAHNKRLYIYIYSTLRLIIKELYILQ